ncbi:MAG: Wzz/FepE/Etk N-terminal domain-containing protein [Bacteroidales bacterium]|jgi:uncharacterized protein involved in exopolysaccharide biosynthesis|nr:Wzz/FepE/Etk N-terminal domain-containing protein [Bacteroidales bacterium]
MEDQNKTGNEFNSERLFLFLTLWKKPLAIVAVVSALASIIFSSPYFIPPKYKSMVIMYPASTSSISKVLLTESNGPKQDILEFGEEQQAEQMLQILNSNSIRDKIIQKYNLQDHYDIKSNSKYKITELYKEYETNITFRRTENMAIKITVLDSDPQIAADIANDIAALFDSTKAQMQNDRAFQAFKIVEREFEKLKGEISSMEDSLTVLRGLGVFDYESQSEMINQQLAKEIASNNRAGIKALEEKLDILARYGGPYVSLRNQLEHEKKQLSLIKSKYEEAKVDAEQVLPQKFVVNTAYKAEKKSVPIRWLIVLISVFGSIFTAVLLIVILERIPGLQLKKKT